MVGLEISEAKCSHNLGFQRYATVQSIPGEFVGLTVKLYTVRALGVRRIIKKPATAFAQHTEQDKSSENYPL